MIYYAIRPVLLLQEDVAGGVDRRHAALHEELVELSCCVCVCFYELCISLFNTAFVYVVYVC